MKRVLVLEKGIAMAVSDLQGNRRDFERVLQVYEALRQADKCRYLLICGDLIHGYPGYEDESFYLLDTLMRIREQNEDIIHLMGNHELVHVLHWELQKGMVSFTSRFEEKIKENRQKFATYLADLPFACITKGQLVLNHTGISAVLAGEKDERWDLFFRVTPLHLWYANLNFEKEFAIRKEDLLTFQPKLGEKFMNLPQGSALWEIFMNKNEHSCSSLKEYVKRLQATLEFYSKLSPAKILVSSHIEEKKGFKRVHEKHLRICTSYGAQEDENKKYLLFNCEKNYENSADLELKLRNLY